MQRLGFALLHNVPRRDAQVPAVAETFGFVRETAKQPSADGRAFAHLLPLLTALLRG